MSKLPTLKRAGDSFVVSTPDHEWILDTFEQGRKVLALLSRPDVAEVFSCNWMVQEGYTEDGEAYIVPCEAPAIGTNRGFECAAGHSHVDMSVRAQEDWDYCDDDEIAAARNGSWTPGFEPVPMNGGAR